MAEIVNLRQVRKRKARSEKERQADQNRALHGRSKTERTRDLRLAQSTERFIEGHRREPAGKASDGPRE